MKKTKTLHNKKTLDAMELSLLCHQLALVFKSGVSPLEGIPILSEDTNNPAIKKPLEYISEKMLNGMSMYQAFLSEGNFPDYMLNMIKIGEMTGMLDTVMENLSVYYENESDLNREMKNAITYPVILALLMVGVIGIMILKVIPMFAEIVESLGGQISKEAQILFSFTLSLERSLLWLVVILVPVIIAIVFYIKTPKGRFVFDRLKVQNPVTGPLYRKIIAYRIGQGLSLTTQSGMNAIDGFNAVKELINNKHVTQKLEEASQKLTKGESFSDVARQSGIFPELFSKMIRTAELSGNLDSVMKKLSRVYGKEAEISLKRFSKTIEPALVAILSIILGIVLLSVLLPLIGMMSSIG
ncbi:MAG: type II secretion system F family protein [Acetivibrionales bacterium]|jgi:type IV pilus assembly protein PilC|nr:type II secretion system F family protein [Clostridiaceae bacterium]